MGADPLVLVPAYRPTPVLTTLVADLREARPGLDVLVVDDGSGAAYDALFRAVTRAGARVVRIGENRGKGAALKLGLGLVAGLGRAVVTADADGQHAVADILAVADAVGEEADHVVLGVRAFDADVPLRSRVGNDATKLLFRLATGTSLRDTQTGLRGLPAGLLGWAAAVEGTRYEWELSVLLRAARGGLRLREVPIETIYLDDNRGSHFRPVVDSARVYAPLLAYVGCSLLSFGLDTLALLALSALLGATALGLLGAVVGARLLSGTVNFALNRRVVFDPRREVATGPAVRRYVALAAGLLALNYALLLALGALGVPLLVAKLVTEVTLVLAGFAGQARVVFRPTQVSPGASSMGRRVRG